LQLALAMSETISLSIQANNLKTIKQKNDSLHLSQYDMIKVSILLYNITSEYWSKLETNKIFKPDVSA
jgi:hypothetical protein